jgi:hypothetical protein
LVSDGMSDNLGEQHRRGGQRRPRSRQERLRIVDGMLCIVLVLVVMQLWLLTATMNAYLSGDGAVVWPAALASLLCFGLNAGLLRYLNRIDQ